MDSSQKGGYIMANKKSKLGMISAVAAGTGTAIYLAQKAKNKSENGDASQSISPLFSKKKTDDNLFYRYFAKICKK